ncbi:unnamed protein product [Caenorhabditis auriculariae]|uniref:ATP citrate synthase n=1 Tax=Caenorhabditis auriculariae TaxID=2777116 RepID=A0A8S1GUW9_9PELO|nr:unnamed protein product [Caenorhabditis auriculariae]
MTVSSYSAKKTLCAWFSDASNCCTNIIQPVRLIKLNASDDFEEVVARSTMLNENEILVIQSDHELREGSNLIKMGTQSELRTWFHDACTVVHKIDDRKGVLHSFFVEPSFNTTESDGFTITFRRKYDGDLVAFRPISCENGNDTLHLFSPTKPNPQFMTPDWSDLFEFISRRRPEKLNQIKQFVRAAYWSFKKLPFKRLALNFFVPLKSKVYLMDVNAELDHQKVGHIEFEWKIDQLESRSPFGLCLMNEAPKIRIIEKDGRLWTLAAGAVALTILNDTICDMGYAAELANYGKYPEDLTDEAAFDYCMHTLSLMTKSAIRSGGKALILAASNTTKVDIYKSLLLNVSSALDLFSDQLKEHNVTVFVRHGGLEYQQGLGKLKHSAAKHGVPIFVFGSETPMTTVVAAALKTRPLPPSPPPTLEEAEQATPFKSQMNRFIQSFVGNDAKVIVWGQQQEAVQKLFHADYQCRRGQPSVLATTSPFAGNHKETYRFGTKNITIPGYCSMTNAFDSHPSATILVIYPMLDIIYETVLEAQSNTQIEIIAIVSGNLQEQVTKDISKIAPGKKVVFIGPATGAFERGCIKNEGFLVSPQVRELRRPGSVACVCRDEDFLLELENLVSMNTNGVYEGVALQSDRYLGSNFADHILRFQKDDRVKIILLLGEAGGFEEEKVAELLKKKKVTKPIVAWCIGTGMDHLPSEALSSPSRVHAKKESASFKNAALRRAGANVPPSFDDIGRVLKCAFGVLVFQGIIAFDPRNPTPSVPLDSTRYRGSAAP